MEQRPNENLSRKRDFSPPTVGVNRRKKKKNTTTILLWTSLTLIVGVIGFVAYRSNSQKEAELQRTYYQLDSISNELNDRILTISQLGGEIDTLISIKETLEAEKERLILKEEKQTEQIGTLRDRVNGYKQLLLAQDKEIEQLKMANEQLLSENTTLKTEKNRLNSSIRSLRETRGKLEETVAIASKLEIEDMTVTAVNKRKKEYKDEFRARHIDNLKIQFYISQNKVAPIEGKDIILRIIGTDGNVLFDVASGSGTFIYKDRELFYTAKQEILYDKQRKLVTFLYNKGNEYSPGIYKVEVYTDDYVMGKGQFKVI